MDEKTESAQLLQSDSLEAGTQALLNMGQFCKVVESSQPLLTLFFNISMCWLCGVNTNQRGISEC